MPTDYLSICPVNEDVVISKMMNIMKLDVNNKLSNYVKENYSWPIVAKELEQFLLK